MNKTNLSALYNGFPERVRRQRKDVEIRELCKEWQEHQNKDALEIIVASFLPLCIKIENKFSSNFHLNQDAWKVLRSIL